MLNPFKPLQLVKAELFSSMPGKFRKKSRTGWSDPNRQNAEVECFLEGPAFDRQGNLFIVDTPFGRIFRIDPKGEWDLVIQYEGWPNGMKFHKDGRLFIADYRKGILTLDTRSAKLETVLETAYSEGFKGCNDLHFTSTGDLYFTELNSPDGFVDHLGEQPPETAMHFGGKLPAVVARNIVVVEAAAVSPILHDSQTIENGHI